MKINTFLKRLMVVCLIAVFCMMFVTETKAGTVNVIKSNGQPLKYYDETPVMINSEYEQKSEMRGVWVSALTGDISGFTSKEQYQQEMLSMLETLEYYNMNTLIFHVRPMNDAFYESKYNSYSSYYNTKATWDPLPWLIEECHKRGIEFHAWMNPYRVTTNVSSSLENIAKNYKASNAASNPDNLLKGTTSVILNPGLPEVRTFLIDTCMELAENYDIDAIHFDDYFYAAGIDDSKTREQYNTTGLSTDDWRREQVNSFIQQLHRKLELLNERTGRAVQLGIAPTGVYKNGDGIVRYDSNGNAITTGSPTRGQTHYSSYLYADTVKWINEGWIDYILPQTYWALEHSACPFADLITWWDKVVKNKDTNLYASLGLYMKTQDGGSSWKTNDYEGYYQAMIVNGLDNTRGISVYNYLSLRTSISNTQSFKKMDTIWSNPAVLPVIRTLKSVVLPKVNNLEVGKNGSVGNIVSWDELENAKFYVIYRSENELTFSNDEVIDIIGNLEYNGRIQYTDILVENDNKEYNYGVRAQSSNNTLGEKASVSTTNLSNSDVQYLGDFETFSITDNTFAGEKVTVRWNSLSYPFGDKINYELYYSFDEGEEVKVTNFYISRVMNCYDISIPNNVSTLDIKLKAYNNIGVTEKTMSVQIGQSLPNITNFGYTGIFYTEADINFVWNRLKEEGVKYTLQYSADGFNWTDFAETSEEQKTFNYYFTAKTPHLSGEIYFRVKASKDDKVSYSNIIKEYGKKYIGDYKNLQVNDEDIKDYYILDENDELIIKWRKGSVNGSSASYLVMYSYDLELWQNVRLYNSKSSYTESGSLCTQLIPITYKSSIVYFKVTGNVNGYENESQIIRVHVRITDLFFEEFITFVDYENKSFVELLDIYN